MKLLISVFLTSFWAAVIAHPSTFTVDYTTNAVTGDPLTQGPNDGSDTTISPVTLNPRPSNYGQVAIYLEYNFDWSNLEGEIQQALTWGYNRFYIGYYMSIHGCTAACLAWVDLGNTRRTNVKNMLKSANAEIYLSLGGPGESMETVISQNSAMTWGQQAGQFANKYLFDGVDVAVALAGEPTPMSPSPYATNGQFVQATQDVVTGVRSNGFAATQMIVSSHAPYFSPAYVSGDGTKALSYLALPSNSKQPWYAAQVGLDMINEGGDYMSYNEIFYQNTWRPGSSVKEIANLGISTDFISVIKPISANLDTVKDDYVDPTTLATWGCQAANDFYWYGGFIGWTWNNLDGNAVQNFGRSLCLGSCP